jgi:hypothetical protein
MKWTTMVPDVRAISGLERVSPKLMSRSAQTEVPPDGFSLHIPGDETLPPVYLQVSDSGTDSDTVKSTRT